MIPDEKISWPGYTTKYHAKKNGLFPTNFWVKKLFSDKKRYTSIVARVIVHEKR